MVQTFPGSWSTNKNSTDRTWVDPPESIGTPEDAPAVSILDENSAFSLVKGMLAGLGLPAGTGAALVNTRPHGNHDPLITLGDEHDAPAASPSDTASAISLLKGILVNLGL